MDENFGQTTSPIGALRSILDNYPYSVGLFRELFQNSDDAGALKQILALDRRRHPAVALYHPDLASTQGPALLAFNDAEFAERDWRALQYAYESSKSDDSSKIGKYGVGFRSVFHITDCPQIVSGNFLAMFDPLCAFTGSTGIKKDLGLISSLYPDQLAPFRWFSDSIQGKFNGTVVRCPLRTMGSKIRPGVVDADNIAHLFHDFITEELGISLLFLQNIQHVEIHDINEHGVSTCLATLSISRSTPASYENGNETYTATVKTEISSVIHVKHWRILHCPFQTDESIRLLSAGFPGDPTAILKEHKLLPNVGLATALDSTVSDRTSGRLFTYLPLPLPTGFCAHIHALFALTQSRQHLRNPREIGIVAGSSDQILLGWNRLLFDFYIPQAWNQLLEVLAQTNGTRDIYGAWPPEQQSPATSGENVYWELLPLNLFKSITSSTSSVWPVYQRQPTASSTTEYQPLHLLITAEPTTSQAVLGALTSMGLRLTCPPAYIFRLIKHGSDERFAILTPEVAHSALLNHLDLIQSASKEDLSVILEYLLSTSNVLNIVGLPIMRITSGEIIALLAKADAVKTHTLLNHIEYDVFGSCDDTAIALHPLSLRVAEVLRTHGPKFLNVETLSVSRIIEYLTIYPNRMGLDLSLVKTDARVIQWLSAFWVWIKTYECKDELFPKITNLYLLPSTRGLKKAEPLFKSRGEHPNSVQTLSLLGISFLDADLSDAAQAVLASYGLLKTISDIHGLLDSLPSSPVPNSQPLSQEACKTVLRHISSRAPGSCILHGPFKQEQIRRLKSLPIFPMATFPPSNVGLVVEWTPIPEGISLRSIANPPFLPSIPEVGFIQLSSIAPTMLEYVESSSHRHLSNLDVLSLTVENFSAQPNYVHAGALDYIVRNRHNIPPFVLDLVRNAKFAATKDGSRRKPADIVDPDAKLASLYDENPEKQIQDATPSEQSIICSLQSLHLMQRTLTTAVAQERIDSISSKPSSPKSIALSRSLLSLITIGQLDCSRLKIKPEQRWLPTEQGLCGSAECHDPNQISPHLFDQVLAVLEPFTLPSSLKRVLGWEQPLPTNILIKQLDRVLDGREDVFLTVLDIIKELSVRDYGDKDLQALRKVTSHKKWVPTTDHQLSETRNAVFLPPIAGSGFCQALSIDPKTRGFLRHMGCMDRPSAEAIIMKLKELQEQPASLNTISVALGLLQSVPTNLNDSERAQLLVPDITGTLQSFSAVYFNDIGEHARLIPSGNDFITHHLVDEPLVRKLKIGRLGLKYVDISVPTVDLGEKPVTTVRKTLSQYTEKQFATEFLANAADANASEFALLLNEFHASHEEDLRALSPIMAKFCVSPSIVVYNNAIFSDKDFIGICQTSIGGKKGKRGTIGQFGLGVLTMFHFTEMAILISNSSVLFLNPSEEHLPISDAASLMLPLNHVRKYYPSHLASVDGLFDFEIASEEPYNGTIFILPLRENSHCEGFTNVISHAMRTSAEMEYEILDNFRELASNCLLFTGITKISGLVRDPSGTQRLSWYFEADRTPSQTETDSGYWTTDITIMDMSESTFTWRTANVVVPEEDIPQQILSPLLHQHSPRLPPIAGLAVSLEDTSVKSGPYKFFSTLPLGILTSLPMHVMATFLLSSDRRNIRLDEYGTPESKFNNWLLSHVIPPMYLFLLQNLLQFGDNKAWWPGQHRSSEDYYSRLIVNAFYSDHLKVSTRPLFRSAHNQTISLSPQNVVLSGEEPPSVQLVLSILQSQRTAKLSKGAYRLAKEYSGIAIVDQTFLASEILQGGSSMISELDSKTVEDVIGYLLDKAKGATNLLGLAILPLEDGTFGTFQSRSDPMSYFAWMPRKQALRHHFPPGRFVHPTLKVRELLKLELNVVPLDAQAIKQFVEARLPSSSPFEAPPEVSNWIYDFWNSWDEYAHLGLASNVISEFPLVPSIRPSSFVSLASCKNAGAVLVEGSSPETELIRAFLDNLDVNVVRVHEDHIPPALYHILRTEEYPSFKFETVLIALASHQDSLAETISNFDDDLKTTFATWARGNIHQAIPDHLQSIAQQLPLWPSAASGSFLDLFPASDVHMLPEDIDFDTAARFMNVRVAEYGSLRFLNGPKLTLVQLKDKLELPASLPAAHLVPYKQFLGSLIPRLPSGYSDPIPILNCDRVIRPSSELYAREPLFQAAFGDDSQFFIHPEFQELEGTLYKHGLRTENQLDVSMFIDCVDALNGRDGDDTVAANILFEAYGFSLPMRIAAREQHLWQDLDDLPFIPRDMATHRRLEGQHATLPGLEIPPNVAALARIVTPLDLVRNEFEAVAWTQRALFAVQPNQRVVLAHPELGRPTISEVVAHLQVLSSLRNLSQSQRQIVLHDVQATYDFLNDKMATNAAAAESVLSQLGDAEIFLNVNDPETDVWRWDKADELVFESQDVDESIRHVRSFLAPFAKLLRAVGVLQVHHPQYPSNQSTDDAELKLVSIRSGFEELRKKKSLTDVAFIAGDHAENSEPLVAHRSFLAVCSEYFADSFCGGYAESRPASADEPITVIVSDYSMPCVRLVLDYIYIGTRPSAETSSLDLLLQAMQLSGYWAILDLFEDIQREIAIKMIKPRSLNQIRTAAEVSHADKLLQTCVEYEEQNPDLIRKYASRHSDMIL